MAFGPIKALDRFDLTVPPRQVVAILGPNGAGKTTFVRAVATLVPPTSGELRVRGHDVRRDPMAVRRRIGLAGQFAAVEPTMSGRENLEMTARLFGHQPAAARRAAALVIEQLGLGKVADRRCSTYSGGERRRLDLGAGLVGAPELLLLDEPTTGLDPAGRAEVWDTVRSLVGRGTDVLLTTHYLDEANELADHVVVIDRGRAIAAGTVADLKAGVGGDLIELAVTSSSELSTAGRLLETVTSSPARLDPNRRRASAPTAAGTRDLAALIRALDEAAIGVDEVGLRRPNLDEVFFALVGEGDQGRPSAERVPEGSLR